MRAIPIDGRAETAPTLNSLSENDHDFYFLGIVEVDEQKGILKKGQEVRVVNEKETQLGLARRAFKSVVVSKPSAAEVPAAPSKIAGAIADRYVSGSRESSSKRIPHTCRTGKCLEVVRWGDDEEDEVQNVACMACLRGERPDPHRREQAVDVVGRRSGKVSFHPRVRVYKIKPCSEVYGLHPRVSNFDENGKMQPTAKAVVRDDCRQRFREAASG